MAADKPSSSTCGCSGRGASNALGRRPLTRLCTPTADKLECGVHGQRGQASGREPRRGREGCQERCHLTPEVGHIAHEIAAATIDLLITPSVLVARVVLTAARACVDDALPNPSPLPPLRTPVPLRCPPSALSPYHHSLPRAPRSPRTPTPQPRHAPRAETTDLQTRRAHSPAVVTSATICC